MWAQTLNSYKCLCLPNSCNYLRHSSSNSCCINASLHRPASTVGHRRRWQILGSNLRHLATAEVRGRRLRWQARAATTLSEHGICRLLIVTWPPASSQCSTVIKVASSTRTGIMSCAVAATEEDPFPVSRLPLLWRHRWNRKLQPRNREMFEKFHRQDFNVNQHQNSCRPTYCHRAGEVWCRISAQGPFQLQSHVEVISCYFRYPDLKSLRWRE